MTFLLNWMSLSEKQDGGCVYASFAHTKRVSGRVKVAGAVTSVSKSAKRGTEGGAGEP